MKIAFIDLIPWDWDLDAPFQRPLGGTQSALAYLAIAMAKRGHEIAIINKTTNPGHQRGVDLRRASGLRLEELRDYDAVVSVNCVDPERVRAWRKVLGRKIALMAWVTHATDQRAVQPLTDAPTRDAFDAYALLSEWQSQTYQRTFGVPGNKIRLLRNAVAPGFEGAWGIGEPILPQKAAGPVLAYTSTPYRGLDVLLDAFPKIRAAVPGTRLRVYSSMGVYQVGEDADKYAKLYVRCKSTDGVDYIGSVPQPQLAAGLREVTALCYPNTFAETSCISAMEAMAAGAIVISAQRGALPETTGGFGELLPPPFADKKAYAAAFAQHTVRALRTLLDEPARAESRARAMVAWMTATCTWDRRAVEWEEATERVIADLPR